MVLSVFDCERNHVGTRLVKSYIFTIEIEEDNGRWSASVPALEDKGAAAWGNTKDEALRNIQEVTQMVIECLLEDGESLPESVQSSDQPAIAVNV